MSTDIERYLKINAEERKRKYRKKLEKEATKDIPATELEIFELIRGLSRSTECNWLIVRSQSHKIFRLAHKIIQAEQLKDLVSEKGEI